MISRVMQETEVSTLIRALKEFDLATEFINCERRKIVTKLENHERQRITSHSPYKARGHRKACCITSCISRAQAAPFEVETFRKVSVRKRGNSKGVIDSSLPIESSLRQVSRPQESWIDTLWSGTSRSHQGVKYKKSFLPLKKV